MPFEYVSGMVFGKLPPNRDVVGVSLLEIVKRACNKLAQSIPALIGALPSICRKFQFRHVQPLSAFGKLRAAHHFYLAAL